MMDDVISRIKSELPILDEMDVGALELMLRPEGYGMVKELCSIEMLVRKICCIK